MTACRSSFFLADTRSWSPWICACTPLGPCSRMTLLTFLALSWLMPSLTVAVRRYSLPDCCGSPASSVLSEICRLTSFSLKTSSSAAQRSSRVGLDDDRLAGPGDLGAGALEVVAGRRLLGGLVQGVVDLLAVDLAHDVERRVSHARAPCYRLRRTREGVQGRVARVVKGSRL